MALSSAAGDLDRARRRVAADRMQPDAFHDDRAELVQVEELRVFDAIAERARGHHDRVLQLQLADLDREIHGAPPLNNIHNITEAFPSQTDVGCRCSMFC